MLDVVDAPLLRPPRFARPALGPAESLNWPVSLASDTAIESFGRSAVAQHPVVARPLALVHSPPLEVEPRAFRRSRLF